MGELMDLNSQIPQGRIDEAIARDTEVFEAIASTFANFLSILPRSGVTNVDANTAIQEVAAGFKWIDGSGIRTNFPGGLTGCLIQFDALFGTGVANKYRIQFYSTQSVLYFRNEINGVWGSWRILN